MTYIAKPKFHHPDLPKNDLGYTHRDYEGTISTLCAGCGHDSITASIIEACFELSIEPHRVAKISGIGCSSKTPTYFLGNSHGFNSVHGRMPSVLTGANLANRDLIYLGVSGDGDSASIGFGQFAHALRRGVNMVYIVENNGVYGLTKGQFSATADRGSKSKRGVVNTDNSIDLAGMALQLGATFVARSFSGDKHQLVPIIKAAIEHEGAAFIDVISPCVAFNNHAGSTKSFDYVREHNEAVNRLDVLPARAPITVDYAEGAVQIVEQHDGSKLALRKLGADYDLHDRYAAMNFLHKHAAKGQIVTGVLFIADEPQDLHQALKTVDTPLNTLGGKRALPRLGRAREDQRIAALTSVLTCACGTLADCRSSRKVRQNAAPPSAGMSRAAPSRPYSPALRVRRAAVASASRHHKVIADAHCIGGKLTGVVHADLDPLRSVDAILDHRAALGRESLRHIHDLAMRQRRERRVHVIEARIGQFERQRPPRRKCLRSLRARRDPSAGRIPSRTDCGCDRTRSRRRLHA